MNKLDKYYTDLLQDILDNGVENKNANNSHILLYFKDLISKLNNLKKINYYIGPWNCVGVKYVKNYE
jgi:hypothetical protein